MNVIDKYQSSRFEHSIDNSNNRLSSTQSLGQVRTFEYIRYVSSFRIYLCIEMHIGNLKFVEVYSCFM